MQENHHLLLLLLNGNELRLSSTSEVSSANPMHVDTDGEKLKAMLIGVFITDMLKKALNNHA